MQTRITTIFENLIEKNLISRASIFGCSPAEIEVISKDYDFDLPLEYRSFLSIAGKYAGKIMTGTDFFYQSIIALRADAMELMTDCSLPDLLPPDAIFINMHQGYSVCFVLPGQDDPAVFKFTEGDESFKEVSPSFTSYLQNAINRALEVWPNLN